VPRFMNYSLTWLLRPRREAKREGRKGGRKGGRKEGRKDGRKGERKEGRKEGAWRVEVQQWAAVLALGSHQL
jgi:predicted transposase YdaD